MSAQIFLIAPLAAEVEETAAMVADALRAAPVAAVLLPRGARGAAAYRQLAERMVAPVQAAGAAMLVEGAPALVAQLGADGLHVDAADPTLAEALATLRPQYIVGIGGLASRDAAMEAGEREPDYVFFGALGGACPPAQRELARWWGSVMEVPSVFGDPNADLAETETPACEFLGLGESLWAAPQTIGARLAALAKRLEA